MCIFMQYVHGQEREKRRKGEKVRERERKIERKTSYNVFNGTKNVLSLSDKMKRPFVMLIF